MYKDYVYFKDLPLQTEFRCNGARFKKQSDTTASLIEDPSRCYLAARMAICEVGPYCRLTVQKTTLEQ